MVPTRGIEPRSSALQADAVTRPAQSAWSQRRDLNSHEPVTGRPCCRYITPALVQARGFAPRSSGNRPEVLLLDEAWGLGARNRYVTLAMEMAVGPGLEPGSFRLTGGSVTDCTTLQRRLG